VAPYASYHLVSVEGDGKVKSIRHVKDCGMRINGGYFVLRPEIFEWMRPGEELVQEPFQRLAAAGKLLSYSYDGFWACMDTFKDKQMLEDLYTRGHVPWEVWKPALAAAR
jgi:glucose-1-phosphate cytidylyltransferase